VYAFHISLFRSDRITNLTEPQLTSFHLNWVAAKRPNLPWLRPIRTQYRSRSQSRQWTQWRPLWQVTTRHPVNVFWLVAATANLPVSQPLGSAEMRLRGVRCVTCDISAPLKVRVTDRERCRVWRTLASFKTCFRSFYWSFFVTWHSSESTVPHRLRLHRFDLLCFLMHHKSTINRTNGVWAICIAVYCKNNEASASLFRRFTDTNVYGAGSEKYGKLATKYPWIYGYFTGYANVTSVIVRWR